MSPSPLKALLQAAVAEGLVPTAEVPPQHARPWPVVLLTALGAWLAALPLMIMVALLLGDVLVRGVGPYLVGALALAGAVVVLRAGELPAFVEQLAVPALLVGGGALGFGLFRDLPAQGASALLALVVVAVVALVNRPWLRVLLGGTAAVLVTIALMPGRWFSANPDHRASLWWAWHLTFALWLAASVVQRHVLNRGARARTAAALESLAAGWLVATLAGLAWWSGMTFLVGGSLGSGFGQDLARDLTRHGTAVSDMLILRGASLALAGAAALWMARQWPTARQPAHALMAAVLVALAWFMPTLGAAWLALAWCATTARWRLAGAAALAAAWIIGAFYYALAWPLAHKALLMVAAAALLGGLAWWAFGSASKARPALARDDAPTTGTLGARLGLALCAAAVFAVANVGIWQKETLIAHGQPVFLALAPADPRSLLQGDFMRLNFNLPPTLDSNLNGLLTKQRPRVVARRDARGVVTLLRIDQGTPLTADELAIELTPKNGRWIFVSDAWFFKEGEAARWSAARFGEFRVDSNGKALLVGLRGGQLEAL
jgi:uncharacterized membrane-anchored protein